MNLIEYISVNLHLKYDLQVTHESTSKIKWAKISMLTNQFQLFKMSPNESIYDMYSRFQDIVHSLIALGKKISKEDQVRKILNSLTSR